MTEYFAPVKDLPIFNQNNFPPNVDEIVDYSPYDSRYVKKTGDTMSGALTCQQNLNIGGSLGLTQPITISSYTAPTTITQVGFNSIATIPSTVTLTTATNVNLVSSIPLSSAGRYFIFITVRLNCITSGTVSLEYGWNTSATGFSNGNSTNFVPTAYTAGQFSEFGFNQVYQAGAISPIIYLNATATFATGTFNISLATIEIVRLS